MEKKVFYVQQPKGIPKRLIKHKFVSYLYFINIHDDMSKYPRDEVGGVEVEFLSKKGLSQYKKTHKIDTVKIIGYTKLNYFKDNEEAILAVPYLTDKTVKSDISFSKKIFHRKIGYIPIVSETNKDINYNSNLFVAVERLNLIPILLLPLILLLLFIFCFHSCHNHADKNITDNHNPEIESQINDTTSYYENPTSPQYEFESNAQPGGELPTGKNSIAGADSIEAALYDANKIYLSSNGKTIDLINPAGNTVNFQYLIYADEKNTELLFSSKLISPGKYIKWNAYDICKSGETTLYVTVKTFDVDSFNECNGYTTLMYIVK